MPWYFQQHLLNNLVDGRNHLVEGGIDAYSLLHFWQNDGRNNGASENLFQRHRKMSYLISDSTLPVWYAIIGRRQSPFRRQQICGLFGKILWRSAWAALRIELDEIADIWSGWLIFRLLLHRMIHLRGNIAHADVMFHYEAKFVRIHWFISGWWGDISLNKSGIGNAHGDKYRRHSPAMLNITHVDGIFVPRSSNHKKLLAAFIYWRSL